MTAGRRAPRRRTELVHGANDGNRPPIAVASWVVYVDRPPAPGPLGTEHLELALVVGGPRYEHDPNGRVVAELWTLHDGQELRHVHLTAIDLAEVVADARRLVGDLRVLRADPERPTTRLRIARAAEVARRFRPDRHTTYQAVPILVALVGLDEEIADVDRAARELVRERLPNAARALWLAGMAELARQHPDWAPGSAPHPRWPEMSGRKKEP